MAEVSIVKENQKKLKAKKFRNSMTFAELMAYSKLEAAQYAIDCGINTKIMGMSAEDYIAKNSGQIKELVSIEEPKDVDLLSSESNQDAGESVLTKEYLQELLKVNGIEFKKTLGEKKLLELAKSNNLL